MVFLSLFVYLVFLVITGPPNRPVLFCSRAFLSSSVVVCNAAGGRAGRHCTAGQYGYVPLGRHLVICQVRRKTSRIHNINTVLTDMQTDW